jgi:hypothetical protein
MCFKIDYEASPWRVKTAYKVVSIDSKGMRSFRNNKFRYEIGQIVRRSYVYKLTSQFGHTFSGIYVCKTLKAARRYAKIMCDCRGTITIIQVAVDPQDLLFVSDQRDDKDYLDCATYDKVKVVRTHTIKKRRYRKSK